VKLRLGPLFALVAIVAAMQSWSPALAAGYAEGADYFSFRDDQITESSGIVASTKRDGVYFTHNDSGDVARFFAVDDRGCTRARYTLAGLATTDDDFKASHDVEDIARGPFGVGGVSTIWLADIGDNLHQRAEIAVHAVTEPNADASTNRSNDGCPTPAEEVVPATTYRLAYPEVAHDAETLLADPHTGQLYVVTKAPTGESQVYAAPPPAQLDPVGVNTLTFVTEIVFPPSTTYDRTPDQIVATAGQQTAFDATGRLWTTGGDIAPDGGRVVLRTYTDAYEWTMTGDLVTTFAALPTVRPLTYDRQGEAITYSRDGASLVTSSEFEHSTAHIYRSA
jgi:hypothetical protein